MQFFFIVVDGWKGSISTLPLQCTRLMTLTEAHAYEVGWRGRLKLGIQR
jgi:hypothetical protein